MEHRPFHVAQWVQNFANAPCAPFLNFNLPFGLLQAICNIQDSVTADINQFAESTWDVEAENAAFRFRALEVTLDAHAWIYDDIQYDMIKYDKI